MFNKTTQRAPEPVAPEGAAETKHKVPEVRRKEVSVIGPTVHFKGELSANEDLLIEGQIEGYIAHQDKNLTVGRDGKVKADIHASAVEVFGEVIGDIKGDQIVRIAKTAKVVGNIQCPRLVVEDGADFTGNVDMTRKGEKSEKPKSQTSPNLVVAENPTQSSNLSA